VALGQLPGDDGGRASGAGAVALALSTPAVEIAGIRHRYGERVALDGISLRIERGELFGLLGPNGGGKSTLFKILCTLLVAEGGTARVLGHDVAREPDRVRRRLGVVFQHASVDPMLTVEENLVHHGHLYGLSGGSLRSAIGSVSERLGLGERRHDRVGTLSGGLQRRTELAKALVVGAELLLLDEPTTGLDPVARREFLGFLAELRAAEGITVVLTTHDMEEAERCERVAILDRGRLVGMGTPAALRARVGGDVLVVHGPDPVRLQERVRARFGLDGRLVDGTLRLERERGHELVRDLIEAFPDEVQTVSYGRPTLDDVFVHLTGHRLAEA
jgi:ABC-2 type transport system ATP-binding protein